MGDGRFDIPARVDMHFHSTGLALGYIVSQGIRLLPQAPPLVEIGLPIGVWILYALHTIGPNPPHLELDRQGRARRVAHTADRLSATRQGPADKQVAAPLAIDRETIDVVVGVVVA